jgi:hypothetical protein
VRFFLSLPMRLHARSLVVPFGKIFDWI